MKLHDKILIPLSWVMAAWVPTTSFAVATAVFAFKVDYRLSRLEQMAGIKHEIEAIWRVPKDDEEDLMPDKNPLEVSWKVK